MLEVAAPILDRLRAGRRLGVVTVTGVARSAPRGVGSSMAVTEGGEVIGSISGGCVEGDAIVLARAVLVTGRAQAARFGFDDETAFAAGLACGGRVDVLAYEVRSGDVVAREALERAAADRPVTAGLVLTGEDAGSILPYADGASVLALTHAPRPRLILLGAGEHAAALCRVGSAAGFAVTVCDVWETLVTPERFPEATERVVGDPAEYLRGQAGDQIDARTAVCVLTHDTRLDISAIDTALALPVGFVGALGARGTVARRAELLRAAGVADADLARLHSPLGLDLGGASPEEVALSALAEIVQVRHGGTGRPLRDGTGPLHGALDNRPTDSPAVCAPGEGRPAWI